MRSEGGDGTVVAEGDLVGDVMETSSYILRSPASTTQDEIDELTAKEGSGPSSSPCQQRRGKGRTLTRGAAFRNAMRHSHKLTSSARRRWEQRYQLAPRAAKQALLLIPSPFTLLK